MLTEFELAISTDLMPRVAMNELMFSLVTRMPVRTPTPMPIRTVTAIAGPVFKSCLVASVAEVTLATAIDPPRDRSNIPAASGATSPTPTSAVSAWSLCMELNVV